MPRSQVLKPVLPCARWTLVFLYLPSGKLAEAQRFILRKLRRLDRPLLIVCASPDQGSIPDEVSSIADALIWKELQGFDFSGYSIGLHAIASASPGADTFVLNDSLFGPFHDLAPWIDHPPWDLTGFTGSYHIEKHIQSYAFVLRGVTQRRMHGLRSIFPSSFSYNEITPVILCFETRFARVAARQMTVGAYWFGSADEQDPSIVEALVLLQQGFPFLKRALLGKHRARQDSEKVREALTARGLSPDAE